MPRHQLGRGATLNTKRAAGGRIAPIKRARFGEFQPNFHGVSIRHSQWVCQVRRIQSYVRDVSHRDVFDAHAGLLWGSICRAKGFCPDFMTWWNNCDHATLDAPATCPVSPPSCRVAQAMFESLALSVRSLEKDLVKSSRQYARLRRANNPNVIFQDIEAAPTQGVELLCKPVVATVSIILSSLHSWNLDRPVMVGGRRREIFTGIISVSGLTLLMALNKGPQFLSWITKGQPLSLLRSSLKLGVHGGNDMMTSRQSAGRLSFSLPKTSCLEVGCLGSLLTLKLWEVVWFAKRPPPLQGWTACPSKIWEPCPIVCLKISAESLLLQNQVGCGQHKWFGRVTCLAKSDSPQSASDFRPTTVLGLIYRCYGTFHARHAIRVMEDVLPEHLYGSGVGVGLC